MAASLYRSWCSHRGGALAAELLLFALLSTLPILLCVSALLGALGSIVGPDAAARLEASVQTQVVNVLGDTTPVLELVSDLFAAPSGKALTVGLVVAVYAASRGFISLVGSLDVIFSTSSARGWVAQRVVGTLLSVASLVVLPLAVTLSYTSKAIASRLVEGPLAQAVVNQAFNLIAVVVALSWLTTLYHLAPKARLRWQDHLPGAVVCLAVTVAVTRMFRLLVPVFGANPVFGAIGAVISLLWWGYLASCAFFLGAEVTLRRAALRSGQAS